MATAMLTERGLRRKMVTTIQSEEKDILTPIKKASVAPVKKATKRKSPAASAKAASANSRQAAAATEQNNNVKRPRISAEDSKEDMLATYQPWVIQTYGDQAKTKTITVKKYARILRTIRGEEVVSADNSKFRFWVKAKGFHVGRPVGYDAKPADGIVGRYSVCDTDGGIAAVNEKLFGSARDPSLYVPNAPFKNATGEPVYRKVAVVENFFDIIYNVHVELEGRPGKHAGQKRTYRTITETYAFLPREAVTRFLLGCTECQKHPRSPSPITSVLPTPSPSPTLPVQIQDTLVTSSPGPLPPPPPTANHYQPQSCDVGSTNNNNTAAVVVSTSDLSKTPSPVDPPAPSLHDSTNNVTVDLTVTQRRRTPSPQEVVRRSTNPLDVCNLTARDPPKTPPKKRQLNHLAEHGEQYVSYPHQPLVPSTTPFLLSPLIGHTTTSTAPIASTPNSRRSPLATATSTTTAAPKLWSPVDGLFAREQRRFSDGFGGGGGCVPGGGFMSTEIDYSLPITTTYLKYMRSLGCTDEDALKFESRNENLMSSTPESSENNEDDHFSGTGTMKESDKLKLMLLAWNYHNQTQGNRNGSEMPDLSSVPGGEEMAGLWAQYHSALGLAKGKATPPVPRDQSSPVNAETGSAHDETSSSGNKEDEDDDDDESDDKIDTHTHDPERLKAFNMFVRLFVDENLDRMVPISKQPKEKIQAIIDSCTRQFPEFAERARKRIRTYLKSCRRNKRARDPNSSPWDATRPTPAHLTSVQAEQILASACENESHNAKRMRLGLEPVSQPMPLLPAGATTVDTTASIGGGGIVSRGLDFSTAGNTPIKMETGGGGGTITGLGGGIATSTAAASSTIVTTVEGGMFAVANTSPATTPNSLMGSTSGGCTGKAMALTADIKPNNLSGGLSTSSTSMNGIGVNNTSTSTIAGSAPTAMYRPNFSQAFQRAGPYPLFPGQSPFGGTAVATGVAASNTGGLLTNGPADLSMKQKPLLNHKLNTGEMAAVRQLITGYRESAAFLLRSADELEHLLLQQQQ